MVAREGYRYRTKGEPSIGVRDILMFSMLINLLLLLARAGCNVRPSGGLLASVHDDDKPEIFIITLPVKSYSSSRCFDTVTVT